MSYVSVVVRLWVGVLSTVVHQLLRHHHFRLVRVRYVELRLKPPSLGRLGVQYVRQHCYPWSSYNLAFAGDRAVLPRTHRFTTVALGWLRGVPLRFEVRRRAFPDVVVLGRWFEGEVFTA